MEVMQFIAQYNARTKNKKMSDEDILSLITTLLHTKKYIPITKKKNAIIDVCKNNKSRFDINLSTVMSLINMYTDLSIDENGYDLLCSNNLLEYILGTFSKEYEICIGIMNMYLEDIEKGIW